MEEKIKNIVSLYTKLPVEKIGHQTVIDRTAVTSSIILHRMYGNLRNEGIVVDNYWDIKTYGDLLQQVNGESVTGISTMKLEESDPYAGFHEESILIGSDIEEIKNMPVVNDFREDQFYIMNFNAAEIAYAILQPDPLATFAGLFAAKEAIVKADNSYKNKQFNTIFIDHLPTGKPVHPDFSITISHTQGLAMATAVKFNSSIFSPQPAQSLTTNNHSANSNFLIYFLLFLSGALSAVVYYLLFCKK